MKVELFSPVTTHYTELISDAQAFMSSEGLHSQIVILDANNRDLYAHGIELGSYGQRHMKLKTVLDWTYGTGIAEPRFSEVLKLGAS